jgi:hypothetical protein
MFQLTTYSEQNQFTYKKFILKLSEKLESYSYTVITRHWFKVLNFIAFIIKPTINVEVVKIESSKKRDGGAACLYALKVIEICKKSSLVVEWVFCGMLIIILLFTAVT